uniref:Uncharacterized protein n=1 Tax=viral metagenome TaxID=1070528 RepID=A0A6C0DGQ1_9ZZZZ
MAKKTRMMKKKGMRKTKRRMRGGDPPKTPSKPSNNAATARRMANKLLEEFDSNTSSRSPSSVGSRSPSSVGSRSVTSSPPLNNNPSRTIKFKASNKVAPPPEEKFLATGPCYSSQTCKYGLKCVTTNSYGRRHEREPRSIGKPGTCEYL